MDGGMPGRQPGLRDSDGVRLSVFRNHVPRLRGRSFFPARFAPVRLAHERLGLTSLRILLPFEISARRRS